VKLGRKILEINNNYFGQVDEAVEALSLNQVSWRKRPSNLLIPEEAVPVEMYLAYPSHPLR
jgi:hypothetical protein